MALWLFLYPVKITVTCSSSPWVLRDACLGWAASGWPVTKLKFLLSFPGVWERETALRKEPAESKHGRIARQLLVSFPGGVQRHAEPGTDPSPPPILPRSQAHGSADSPHHQPLPGRRGAEPGAVAVRRGEHAVLLGARLGAAGSSLAAQQRLGELLGRRRGVGWSWARYLPRERASARAE